MTIVIPFPNSPDPRLTQIYVDLTPLLPLGLPFPDWIGWPRSKFWPPPEKIKAIRAIGINATAKKTYDWMRCFAAAEKELMRNIDADKGCRKKCHRIMKRVREQFWCKTTKPAISSYILKVN